MPMPARKTARRTTSKSEGAEGDVFVATESFSTDIDGVPTAVHKGVTRVRAGHELVERYPEFFERADDSPTYEVEQATKAPGEKRGE
jgi:hypothetical protein